jgi:tellurite resistance protein TehA-like permease
VFAHPIARLRHKIDLTVKTTVCGLVVLMAVLVALGFLCAALFMWLAQSYGAITAALVLAGVFIFVALVAVLVAVLMRRHEPPPPPPPNMGALFNDPAMLMAAFDVVRTFGRGKTTAAVLVSAFLGGLLLSRSSRKPEA